jgi:hypothetical protein
LAILRITQPHVAINASTKCFDLKFQTWTPKPVALSPTRRPIKRLEGKKGVETRTPRVDAQDFGAGVRRLVKRQKPYMQRPKKARPPEEDRRSGRSPVNVPPTLEVQMKNRRRMKGNQELEEYEKTFWRV